MRVLRELPSDDLNKRVNRILDGMGVELLDHNKVGFEHMRQFAELLIKCDDMNTDQFKALARTKLCVSMRYINEYYVAFKAWEVFRTHDKKIVMTDQENNGHG